MEPAKTIQTAFLVGCAFLVLPLLAAAQEIDYSPESWDFGEVGVGNSDTQIFTIGCGDLMPLSVDNIELTSSEYGSPYEEDDFSIRLIPELDLPIFLYDLHYPSSLTASNGILFFTADDWVAGEELWRSDGTPEGTVLVKDIHPEGTPSDPYYLADVQGTLFFSAYDEIYGRELYKSDGTEAGTVMVKDINPAGNSTLRSLAAVGGELYFSCHDGSIGFELWKSDGTEAGTVLVKDIDLVSAYGSDPHDLTDVNGTVFFRADDGIADNELWKSDGSSAGTMLVKDINPAGSSWPSNLTVMNETLFFTAGDAVSGSELWKSDGSSAGTVMVKDIDPVPGEESNPAYLTCMNGELFFRADDGITGKELWKSDGSSAGTVMVKEINPGGDAYVSNLEAMNGTLFFKADDGTFGFELWKSDGSSAGTMLVKDINTAGHSNPQHLTAVNGTLYFTADDGISGRELWKSDGTEAGTMLVKDITLIEDWPWPPKFLKDVNGTLFFTAHDGIRGRELYTSDGTTEGTVLLKDICPWIGTSLDVEVTYAPSEPGVHEAFLHIESDAYPPEDRLYLPLTGVGASSHETTIFSCLGDDPWYCFPDLDLFTFEGEEGEEITVRLDEATGDNTGEMATLILKDKIKGVWFFKKDKSALPNEITAVLPASGEYSVWVVEQHCCWPEDPFRGNYGLTLESSGNAYETLQTTCWVE